MWTNQSDQIKDCMKRSFDSLRIACCLCQLFDRSILINKKRPPGNSWWSVKHDLYKLRMSFELAVWSVIDESLRINHAWSNKVRSQICLDHVSFFYWDQHVTDLIWVTTKIKSFILSLILRFLSGHVWSILFDLIYVIRQIYLDIFGGLSLNWAWTGLLLKTQGTSSLSSCYELTHPPAPFPWGHCWH